MITGINGGLTAALSGLDGYFLIHIYDKGFKRYLGNNNVSFMDLLTNIETQTGGRVRHFFPSDMGDDWHDPDGQAHPPPPTPPNLDRGKLLFEVQANSTRAFCTSHRWVAEGSNLRDWQWKGTGTRAEIPQQLLQPYNEPPTPQVPQIFVVNSVHHQLMADFAKPVREVYELPPGVTHSDIGTQMLVRLPLPNWLDSIRFGFPSSLHRPNIFSRPTMLDRRRGLLQQPGGVIDVNCLDPSQTHFPLMTIADLHELGAGPYVADLGPSYVSSFRHKEMERTQGYLNLANHHQSRSQLSQNIPGWYFDQIQAPPNWNTVWPGTTTQNISVWQPVRILTVPGLPSRYTASQFHTVILAYVPDNWPLVVPAPGFKSPPNKRMQMWICGPRTPGKCKTGARTCSCCAHVATAAYICGVLAHSPALFRTRWRNINYLDAGSAFPAHTTDILAGLAN